MKLNNTTSIWRRLGATGVACGILLSAAPRIANADTEFEWDPTWGMHEEEWYDPSDWFNDEDNKVNIEEVGTYGYDDNYYTDGFWNGYSYYGYYGYDPVNYDLTYTGYDSYWQWNPEKNEWTQTSSTDSEKSRDEARKRSEEMTKKDPTTAGTKLDKKEIVTMRGTVSNMTRVKTKGAKQEHTYAVLDVDDKRSVLVDFGPKAEMGDVKIEKGKKLQVRGPRAKLNGRYLLVAQQVSPIKDKDMAGEKKE